MEQQEKGERAVDMRRTADEQLSPQQNHILWACQQDTWKIQLIPVKGLKRQGGGQLRNRPRCKKWNIGRKKSVGGEIRAAIASWERASDSTENQLEDEFLLALSSAGNPAITRPWHVSPFYPPVMFVVAIWAFSIAAHCFAALHHIIRQNVSNVNWKQEI